MKVKTKAPAKAGDCFRLATRLEKVRCAINRANAHAGDGHGDAVKYHIRPAIMLSFELGMLHPSKKAEFDKLAEDLRAIGRYTKDELSRRAVDNVREKLADLGDRLGNLRQDVKVRCRVHPVD